MLQSGVAAAATTIGGSGAGECFASKAMWKYKHIICTILASLEPDGGADKGEDSDVAEDDGDDEVGGMVSLLCPKLTKEEFFQQTILSF